MDHAGGLFDQIGGHEGRPSADHGRGRGHLQAVEKGLVAPAAHARKIVMGQGQRQVIGPNPGQGGKDRHGEKPDHGQGHGQAEQKKRPVAARVLNRDQGHATGRDQGRLPGAADPVGHEGQDRGDEQDDADRGPHDEIVLADDLLVDVRGQDVEKAAHHLGRPEIRKAQDEPHEAGADQPVPDAGQGHGEKDPGR
jgi:hypothetical protein